MKISFSDQTQTKLKKALQNLLAASKITIYALILFFVILF